MSLSHHLVWDRRLALMLSLNSSFAGVGGDSVDVQSLLLLLLVGWIVLSCGGPTREEMTRTRRWRLRCENQIYKTDQK